MIKNYDEAIQTFNKESDLIRETLDLIKNLANYYFEDKEVIDFDNINNQLNFLKKSLQVNDSEKYQSINKIFDFLQFLFVDKLENIYLYKQDFNNILVALQESYQSQNYLFSPLEMLDIFRMILDNLDSQEKILDLLNLKTIPDLPKIDIYSNGNLIRTQLDVTSKKISGTIVIQELLKKYTSELEQEFQAKIKDSEMSQDDFRDSLIKEKKKESKINISTLLDLRYNKYPDIKKAITSNLDIRDSGHFVEMLLIFVKDYSSPSKLRELMFNKEDLPLILAVCRDLLEKNISDIDTIKKDFVMDVGMLIQKIRQMDLEILEQTEEFNNKATEFLAEKDLFFKESFFNLSEVNYTNVDRYKDKIANLMTELAFMYQGQVQQNIFGEFIKTLQEAGISDFYIKKFDRVNIKSAESVIKKIKAKGEGFDLSQMMDLIRCRLIVEDLGDVRNVAKLVDETFKDAIIEKEDKYMENNEKIPYRAIHYLIRIDEGICFELQIKTFSDVVIGELEHYFGKEQRYSCKNLLNQTSADQQIKKEISNQKKKKNLITSIFWKLQDVLFKKYMLSISQGGKK